MDTTPVFNYNNLLLKLKPLLPKLLIILVILATLTGTLIFFTAKTASVTLNIAPSSATVKIGKKSYGAGATVKLRPGTYSVEISAQGFVSQTDSLTLSRYDSQEISIYLTEDSNTPFAYYETDSTDLYFLRKYLHSHQDDEPLANFLSSYDKKLSIHDILPLYAQDSGGSYYIFFETSLPACKNLYCLQIGASSQAYYDRALADLRSHGFSPSDYQLISNY